MDWGAPATYLAILFTAIITTALNWWREDRQRRRAEAREDVLRADQERRQDEIAARQMREWAQQQWWEKKYEAYANLSEALWQMLQEARDMVEYYDSGHRGEVHVPEEFGFDHKANIALLRRTSDVTQFLVSREVAEALGTLVRDLEHYRRDNNSGPDDIADWQFASIEHAAKVVRTGAIRDLNLVRESAPSVPPVDGQEVPSVPT